MIPTFGSGGRGIHPRSMPHDKAAKKRAKIKKQESIWEPKRNVPPSYESVIIDFLETHPSLKRNPMQLFQLLSTFNKLNTEHPKMPMHGMKVAMIERHRQVGASDVNSLVDKLFWAKHLPGGSFRERKIFLKLMGEKLAREISETRKAQKK